MYRAFAGSSAAYRAWWETISQTHQRRIRLIVMSLEHETLSEFTPRYVTGQITFDRSRVPTRIAEITLFDPDGGIRFEPDSPTDAPVYRSRMLQIRYEVLVPAGPHGEARWFSCPVFTGPVDDLDRTGAEVRLIAHGKEVLAGEAGTARAFPKRSDKAAVVRALLVDAGETKLRIPNRRARLPDRLVIAKTDSRWAKAKRLAASMDDQLSYDGRGTAVMRRPSGRHSLTIDGRRLCSEVSVDRGPGATGGGGESGSDVHNRWEVTGGTPKGTRKKVKARVDLPPGHKLSARSLSRNGKPRILAVYVDNPHVKTLAAALRLAQRMRDASLRLTSNYSCEVLPIPNLEEGDVARIWTRQGWVNAPLDQWTLSLGDGPMTLGALRRAKASGPTRGRQRAWWVQLPAPRGRRGDRGSRSGRAGGGAGGRGGRPGGRGARGGGR